MGSPKVFASQALGGRFAVAPRLVVAPLLVVAPRLAVAPLLAAALISLAVPRASAQAVAAPSAAGGSGVPSVQDAPADFSALLAELSRRSSEAGFAELTLSFVRSRRSLAEALEALEALAPLASEGRRAPLLRERAILLQAAGRWAQAAETWQELARLPSERGAQAELVASALCLLYAGEGERALLLAEAAGLSAQDRDIRSLAALVAARARAASGEREVALKAARALIDGANPTLRLAALELAASLAEGPEKAEYERRIKADFGGVGGGSQAFLALLGVSADSGWALSEDAAPTPNDAEPQAAPAAPLTAPPTVPAGGAQGSSSAAAEATAGPTYFQVGAFRERANAQALVDKLGGKGFDASLRSRSDDKGAVFTVLVPAGKDPGATLLRIKDAGLEAWPLF